MEQHDPSQSRQPRQSYGQQQQQQQQDGRSSTQGQFAPSGSVERVRQTPYLQQSPVSAPPLGRPGGEGQPIYGFAPTAQYGAGPTLQPSPMQYGPEIQAQDTTRQQGQQYAQYPSNILYGMAQSQGAPAARSAYGSVSQYGQRPGTGSETMGAQFGVPQGGQYYLAGQPGPTGAPVSELAPQNMPAQYPPPETYPGTMPPIAPGYPTALMDPSQPAAFSTYAPQAQYAPPQQIPPTDQAFERYQSQVRNIFTLARDGSLRDIGALLLEISRYLLGNAETLGLTRDDETLHDGRIRLWDEFNRTWLVTLQRQFDLTEEMTQTGRPLSENRSIMDMQTLEGLSNELISLCDDIEKHGLVDYQMGVAEEEIMDIMLGCISLLNATEPRPADPQTESSTAGASRGR